MILSTDPHDQHFDQHDRILLIEGLQAMAEDLLPLGITITEVENAAMFPNKNMLHITFKAAAALIGVTEKRTNELNILANELLDLKLAEHIYKDTINSLERNLAAYKADPNFNDEVLTFAANLAETYATEGVDEDTDSTVFIFDKATLKQAMADAIFSYNNYSG